MAHPPLMPTAIYDQAESQLLKAGGGFFLFTHWVGLRITHEDGTTVYAEALMPKRGEIRLRYQIGPNQYQLYRFNRHKQLVYAGITDGRDWRGSHAVQF